MARFDVRAATRRSIAAAALAIVIGLACAPANGRSEASSAPPASDAAQLKVIDHLTPKRDSIGGVPDRFEWTRVEGADSYAIGLWNEVDVMLWRQDGIPVNHVGRPKELQLDAGTYMWSVTALRGGEPVGDSGLAAFIVRTEP